MTEQTNKEKIIIVLKESVKFARETNFVYDNMFEKHKEVGMMSNLQKTIKEKIELFSNMNESSHLFQTIYDCAKLAHSNMIEKKTYNYYCAELIMKINSLENVFRKRLRPIGIHINSDARPTHFKSPEKKTKEEDAEGLIEAEKTHLFGEEEVDEDLYYVNKSELIEQGLTGSELSKRNSKRAELINTLKSTSFD